MAPIIVTINIAAITILSAVIHWSLVSGFATFFTVSALCLESLKIDVSNLIIIGKVFNRVDFIRTNPQPIFKKNVKLWKTNIFL